MNPLKEPNLFSDEVLFSGASEKRVLEQFSGQIRRVERNDPIERSMEDNTAPSHLVPQTGRPEVTD